MRYGSDRWSNAFSCFEANFSIGAVIRLIHEMLFMTAQIVFSFSGIWNLSKKSTPLATLLKFYLSTGKIVASA